jgi:hypothetical protein
MWRPTISRSVYFGRKHPSGAYYHTFVTVRQLWICWCGALSLTRGRVCRLQLLLALANADILGFESRGTRGHILQSQIRDFPFRRLLRLAGLRCRYSTTPPHGMVPDWIATIVFFITPRHEPHRKHPVTRVNTHILLHAYSFSCLPSRCSQTVDLYCPLHSNSSIRCLFRGTCLETGL